jgi:cardiolipin synthase
VNLDYRSLVHHFENGVWLYRCACIEPLKKDMEETLSKCIAIDQGSIKIGPLQRIFRSVIRIFSPLM